MKNEKQNIMNKENVRKIVNKAVDDHKLYIPETAIEEEINAAMNIINYEGFIREQRWFNGEITFLEYIKE